jgi:hypothetical protein
VSAPATATITVTARPDPGLDPNVRALSDAQAESTRRFAQAQSRNFLQRAEQLHNGGGSASPRMGISFGFAGMRSAMPDYDAAQREALGVSGRMSGNDMGRFPSAATGTNAAAPDEDGAAGNGERAIGSVAIWSGGQISIGAQDRTTRRSKISVTSGGLSAGADVKLSDSASIGIGGGVGFDDSKIGGQAASLKSDSSVIVTYGSLAPVRDMFFDFVVGYGDLGFKTRRAVDGGTAIGSRDGTMWFGAASAGIDRVEDDLRWSLYGRGEWVDGKLGAYAESGGGIMNLRFDARSVRSLAGVLGARIEVDKELAIGVFRPRVRLEWSHEFRDSSVQMLDYADIPGDAFYGIRTDGWSRDQYEVGFGGGLYTHSRWIFDFELQLRGAAGERNGRLMVKLAKEF